MVARPTIIEPNFDSVLHPARSGQPARLLIKLKVALLPRDPSKPGNPASPHHDIHLAANMGEVRHGTVRDGENFPFHCRSWLESEFNAYCIKFKKMVELSWNNQLILLPPDGSKPGDSAMSDADYLEFINRPDIAAHVQCLFEIALVPVGRTQTHAVIEVVKLEKPAHEQNPMGGFRSFAALLTDEDVDFAPTKAGLRQVAAAHEIGHWLGRPVPLFSGGSLNTDRLLNHVDWEACSADPHYIPGSDCEYGRTRGKQMALLGVGQLLTAYEANIWLTRVERHTRVLFGWDTMHRIHFNNSMAPISARQKRLVAGSGRTPPPIPRPVQGARPRP
jgi:hypothetical protein